MFMNRMSKLSKAPGASNSGYSMLELLVVILIGAILIAVAVPNYLQFVRTNQAVTLTTDFTDSLAYARTEAVKRGTPVSMCAAASAALAACGGSTNWGNGWIIFIDSAVSGTVTSAANILKTHDALATGTSITTGLAFVNYGSTGFVNAGTGTFTIAAPGCAGNNGSLITIIASGRADVAAVACP